MTLPKVTAEKIVTLPFQSTKNHDLPYYLQPSLPDNFWRLPKGPMKLKEWVKVALYIFTCFVKAVIVYDFKLVWVILYLSVKLIFKTIY